MRDFACGKSLLALASVSAVVSLSAVTRAATNVRLEVSARQVEVGDRFTVTLRAKSDDDALPTDPDLRVPAGITASTPRLGTETSMTMGPSGITRSLGLNATWVLTATRAGKFVVGPGTVRGASGSSSSAAVQIEVVEAGALPKNPPPLAGQPFDPFDMLRNFGRGSGFPPGFPFDSEPPQEQLLPAVPEELQVSKALDPIAFVRSRAQPKQVVVGEQVELSVYAYGGRGQFQVGGNGEPSHADFLSFSLQEGEAIAHAMDIGGQRFIAARVTSYALFPVKAGDLKVGAVSLRFVGPGYGGRDPLGLSRSSSPLTVRVVEPPLDGRPPGYRLGDVGRYTLTAQVEPRTVPAGGSVSVVAKLEGRGNLPYSLLVPEQSGVTWLEPQLTDQVGAKQRVIQGFRTFTYVVELDTPGVANLGDITLPYYDAEKRSYGIARASLGTVQVTGVAKSVPAARAGANEGRLKSLLKPSPALGKSPSSARPLADRPWFWTSLWALPLSVVLGSLLTDAARAVNRNRKARRGSLLSSADEGLRALGNAVSEQHPGKVAAAAERALFASIEQATGIRARGLLKSELGSSLRSAGLEPAHADELARVLARCDELRFAGDAEPLAEFAKDVERLVSALRRYKPRKVTEAAV